MVRRNIPSLFVLVLVSTALIIGVKTFYRSLQSKLADEIFSYLHWSNSGSCKLTHDFGGRMLRSPSGLDGQKAVCLDPNVAPKPDDCLVYSFGIKDDWSFDDTMEQYGCEVYAFDPSIENVTDHDRSDKIHFYAVGLSDQDQTLTDKGWRMKSLNSIMTMLGHEKRIVDYLKVDIEMAEWAVLPGLVQSGLLRQRVRQMGFEIHMAPTNLTSEAYDKMIRILESVEQQAGLIRFDSKPNPWWVANILALNNYTGPVAFELAWYNPLL